MNPQQIIDIAMSATYAAMEISAPILLAALAIGLLISIFQAATQINESTLTFLPKMLAIIAVLIIMGPWVVQKFTTFTTSVYAKIPEIVRTHK